jgi:hypothetical protein
MLQALVEQERLHLFPVHLSLMQVAGAADMVRQMADQVAVVVEGTQPQQQRVLPTPEVAAAQAVLPIQEQLAQQAVPA